MQFVKPTNSVEEGPLSVASPNNDDEDKDILTPLPKTSMWNYVIINQQFRTFVALLATPTTKYKRLNKSKS